MRFSNRPYHAPFAPPPSGCRLLVEKGRTRRTCLTDPTLFTSLRLLPLRLDVGVDADDDGQAVDAGFGGLVAVAAGDREGLPG